MPPFLAASSRLADARKKAGMAGRRPTPRGRTRGSAQPSGFFMKFRGPRALSNRPGGPPHRNTILWSATRPPGFTETAQTAQTRHTGRTRRLYTIAGQVMSSKELALPPRGLVTLIVGITVVSLAILSWLGWRLIEQDRMLEGEQAKQRIERAADLVVAALQRALAADEQRLAAGSEQWPDGAVAVIFRDGLVRAYPRERLAYFPVVQPLREAPAAAFSEGEEAEFRRGDHAAAIGVFREMAKSSDPAVRAGGCSWRVSRCWPSWPWRPAT